MSLLVIKQSLVAFIGLMFCGLHFNIIHYMLMDLFSFVSNYFQNQFDTINNNIHDITNIGYTYFLLAIVIKLFREVKNNG